MRRAFTVTVITVVAAVTAAGCAQPPPFVRSDWQEEVVLRNGKTIIVDRATAPGAIWHSATGGPAHRTEQTLRLPDGTIWNSVDLNPVVTSADAVLLDHDGRSWILVSTSMFYGSHVRLGCPVPNFLYQRSSPAGWYRVPPEDVPEGLEFNLLMLSRWRESVGPMLSVSSKERIDREWLAAERERDSKIYRPGADKRYSWMNDLSYLVRFSKYCDPGVSKCVQEPNADCRPAHLLVEPTRGR